MEVNTFDEMAEIDEMLNPPPEKQVKEKAPTAKPMTK